MFILDWIKRFGAREIIQEMNGLKRPFADKMREAQEKFGSISPDGFANQVIGEFQVKLCKKFGVDPKDVGLDETLLI